MSTEPPSSRNDASRSHTIWILAGVVSVIAILVFAVAAIIIVGLPALGRAAADDQASEEIPPMADAPSPTPPAIPTAPATPTTSAIPTTPAQTETPSALQEMLDEAKDLFDSYQYAASAEAYTHVLELDPDNVEALVGRALANFTSRDGDLVRNDLTKALDLEPNNVDALLASGSWALAEDDYLTSLTYLEQALALEPDNPDVYFHYGQFYQDTYQYQNAVDSYTKVIRMEPDRAGAYNNRGAAYSWLGRDDMALADYTRAIELDANYGVPLVNRAKLQLRNGNAEAALVDIEAAKQTTPPNPRVYDLIGSFYSMRYGDYAAAVEAYTTALELLPGEIAYYAARCNAYGKLGMFEEGLADCQYAIKHAPADEIYVYDHLGHFYYEMSDWPSGFDSFDTIIQMGGYAHAYWNRGYGSYRLGNYEEALEDINHALSITEFAGYHYDRAMVYFHTGRITEAFDELDRAFALKYYYLENTKIELPIRVSPESDVLNYIGWGRFYDTAGDAAKAREYYEEFLAAYGTEDDLYKTIDWLIRTLE